MKYYKLSVKRTDKKDKYITFWRANNAGYCWWLEWAGEYDEPGSEYELHFVKHVSVDDVTPLIETITNADGTFKVVKNMAKNRKALGVTFETNKG